MANISDVAERAGVSTSTVSRYLRGEPVKSEAAVRAAVEALDYVPAPAAMTLRSGRHNVIGVVVPDISNPFFAACVRGVEEVSRRSSYLLALYDTDEDPELEARVLPDLSGHVDGVVLTPATDDRAVLRKLLGRVPVVLLDRDVGDPDLDCVLVDNAAGAGAAARYLLELGHVSIGEIAGPMHTTPGKERHVGFSEVLQEAGVLPPECYSVVANFRESDGYQAMLALLGLPSPPTAVFSANNLQTIGALKALRNMGVRVPEEMSIVGFDDLDLGELLRPALSVVARPMYEQGALAARLLMARLRGDANRTGERIVLQTSLVKRESCAAPAVADAVAPGRQGRRERLGAR